MKGTYRFDNDSWLERLLSLLFPPRLPNEQWWERAAYRFNPPLAIPVKEAALCGNCHNLTVSKNSSCTFCGSAAVVTLTTVLPRIDINSEVDKILRDL